MIDYLIGVDGGGSGTRVRLAHPDGRELAQGRGGPSGLMHGIEQAWAAVGDAIRQAFDAAALTPPPPGRIGLGLGMAGVHNQPWAAAFLAAEPGYAGVALDSDAMTTLLGAHGGQAGAIVALGTGSVGELLEADGRRRAVGGWGFPSGDEAGGAWLGLRAMAHMQRTLDGRAPSGPFAAAVLAACGGQRGGVQHWLGRAGQTEFAGLAPLVLAHGASDAAAHAILTEAGAHVERLVQALETPQRLPIALCGGLAEPLRPYLPPAVRRRVVAPQADSASGALHLIRQRLPARAPCPSA